MGEDPHQGTGKGFQLGGLAHAALQPAQSPGVSAQRMSHLKLARRPASLPTASAPPKASPTPSRRPILRSADAAGRCASCWPGLCTPTHRLIRQRALLQSWPRQQPPESPCPQPSAGNGQRAPAPRHSPHQLPHRNGATGTRCQLLYLLHAQEDTKLLPQFRSDFKDVTGDIA